MLIEVKYIGIHDVVIPKELIIEEGSTLKEAIEAIGISCGTSLEGTTYLVNKKKSSLKSKLQEGDEILMLQVLGGG